MMLKMSLNLSLELMTNSPRQSAFPSLLRRIISAIVDFLLIGIIWFPLGLSFRFLPTFEGETVTIVVRNLSNLFLLYIFFLAYFTLGEGILATTLGKFIFGLEVVSFRGRKPTFAQGLIRNIFKPLDLLLLLAPLLLSAKHQTLGDRYAKTLVVKKNSPVPGIVAEDRYLMTFKKIVAVFLLIFSGAFLAVSFYFINNYLPEITAANQAIATYFMRVEKGYELNRNFRAAYETASSQLREEVTLEEYQQRLASNPILPLALEKPGEINFYKWEFIGEDNLIVTGTIDDQYRMEVELHKESKQWKFVSGNVTVEN